jgi:hypothetical protein
LLGLCVAFVGTALCAVIGEWKIDHTNNTQTVSARILTKTEAEEFSVVGALVGYHVGKGFDEVGGGWMGAVTEGLLFTDGCKLPVLVQSETTPRVIDAPDDSCHKLKENNIILLDKTTATRSRAGKIFSSIVSYHLHES